MLVDIRRWLDNTVGFERILKSGRVLERKLKKIY